MKMRVPLPLYALAIPLLLMWGCIKHDVPTPFDPLCCKITEMKDTNETVSFLYDAHGRLEYRMLSFSFRSSPNMKFIYDRHGRVSQYITNTYDDKESFDPGNPFFEWHYLYYDSYGRIAKDTFFGEGMIGPDGPVFDPHMPPNYTRGSKVFEYDAKNRMVRETTKYPFSGGFEVVNTYTYDERGNRLYPGSAESSDYDNKTNFNRTDPLLQFISRDYSLNNQRTATRYNSYRLPLEYPFDGRYTLFDQLGYFDLKIKYRCK